MFGPLQQAGIQEEILTACNKGIQPFILNDIDIDRIGWDTCSFENRIGDITKCRLDFSVANQVDAGPVGLRKGSALSKQARPQSKAPYPKICLARHAIAFL